MTWLFHITRWHDSSILIDHTRIPSLFLPLPLPLIRSFLHMYVHAVTHMSLTYTYTRIHRWQDMRKRMLGDGWGEAGSGGGGVKGQASIVTDMKELKLNFPSSTLVFLQHFLSLHESRPVNRLYPGVRSWGLRYVSVCVCLAVWLCFGEREREREREKYANLFIACIEVFEVGTSGMWCVCVCLSI